VVTTAAEVGFLRKEVEAEMAGQIGAIAEATGAGCRGRGLELGFWDVDGMGLCYGGTRVVTVGSGKWNKDIGI
jgi:hypothetical protein